MIKVSLKQKSRPKINKSVRTKLNQENDKTKANYPKQRKGRTNQHQINSSKRRKKAVNTIHRGKDENSN